MTHAVLGTKHDNQRTLCTHTTRRVLPLSSWACRCRQLAERQREKIGARAVHPLFHVSDPRGVLPGSSALVSVIVAAYSTPFCGFFITTTHSFAHTDTQTHRRTHTDTDTDTDTHRHTHHITSHSRGNQSNQPLQVCVQPGTGGSAWPNCGIHPHQRVLPHCVLREHCGATAQD